MLTEDEYKHAPHVVALEENHYARHTRPAGLCARARRRQGQRLALVRASGRYYDMPPRGDGRPREVYRQTSDWFDSRPGMLWHHGPNDFTLIGNVRFLGYEF